jgi:G3E family GTPase
VIPVHIISGFLGAGKTTFIINLLNQKTTDEQWAIVVNEFGKVNIDGKTIQSAKKGEVYEISGGCICCTAKLYLNESLQEILKTEKYSRIIIEPTGLGGIDMVSEIVSNIPVLDLKPVFCLVDILMVRNPTKLTIPIFKRQIDKADFIIFTKTDLLSNEFEKAELIKIFKANFPKANIWDITKSDISILDVESMDVKSHINQYSLFEAGLSADNYLQKSYTFDNETVFDAEKLAKILVANTSILRAKGKIRTFDGWKLINYTLTGCIFESCLDCSKNEFVIIADKSNPELISGLEEKIKKTTLKV